MGWPLPLDVTVRVVEAVLRDGFDTTLPEMAAIGSVCTLFAAALSLAVADTVVVPSRGFVADHLRRRPARIRRLVVRVGCSGSTAEWTKAWGRAVVCDALDLHCTTPPYNLAAIRFVQHCVVVTRSVTLMSHTSHGAMTVLRGMRIHPGVREVTVGGNSVSMAWRPTEELIHELTVVFPGASTVAIGAIPLFEAPSKEMFMTMSTISPRSRGSLCAAQLESLVKRWPRLRRLAISGGALTSEHLARIASACDGLLAMSISHCPDIDSHAVAEAFDARPSLRFMDLSNVGITEQEGALLGRRVSVV